MAKGILGILLMIFAAPILGAGISEPPTFEKLETFLAANPRIRRISQLLPHLPLSLRQNYTLMYRSRSLQDASPFAPRAILYGVDARFIATFNGEENQEKFDSMEVIQYRDDSASFEFREIQFPESDTNGSIHISEKNPTRCLACHFSDPRPNWEHYPKWPGAFGEQDDEDLTSEVGLLPRLREFLKSAPFHPRYRNLIDLQAQYQHPTGAGGREETRTRVPHNLVFTARVAQLNFNRVARLIRATPQYQTYKYAILGQLYCERELMGFFPPAIASVLKPKFKDFPYDNYGEPERARYLFEARGISVRQWFMDYITEDGDLSFGTPNVPLHEFTGVLVDQDPDLLPFFRVNRKNVYGALARHGLFEGTCSALRERSLQAFESAAR